MIYWVHLYLFLIFIFFGDSIGLSASSEHCLSNSTIKRYTCLYLYCVLFSSKIHDNHDDDDEVTNLTAGVALISTETFRSQTLDVGTADCGRTRQ